MQHIRFFLFLLFVAFTVSLQAQSLAIGNWRYHMPLGNVESVALAENQDLVFAASRNAMFSYDLTTGEIQRFNKVNGLNDVGIQRIGYAPDHKTLIITYSNGNIDFLKDNNTIVNLSALERSPIANTKIINNIFVDDSLAYLSTSFGIVVVDVVNELVRATYIIGDNGDQTPVYDFDIFNGYLWAATADGLKRANPVNSNLQNFGFWEKVAYPGNNDHSVREIEIWQNDLVLSLRSSIIRQQGSVWDTLQIDTVSKYSLLTANTGKLSFLEKNDTTGTNQLLLLDSVFSTTVVDDPRLAFTSDIELTENNEIWAGDKSTGLLYFTDPQQNAELIRPDAPFSGKVFEMESRHGNLWVATGGRNTSFNYNFNKDGIMRLDVFDNWLAYNQFNYPTLEPALDILSVAIHPDPNREDVYFGSYFAGLLHFDGNDFTLYRDTNSILLPRTGDSKRTVINGLAFDEQENLWMTSYDTERPITILTNEGEWLQLKPSVTVEENCLTDVVFDDLGQAWFPIERSRQQGLLVLNHNNTLDDPSDDVYRILRSGEGLGNLPSNRVFSIAKDENGEIWVGTEQGLAVFYCPTSALTESGCDAQQIFVEQDGLGAFLLDEQTINVIEVDGGNRKWIGTTNGVWLFSPDGTEELEYFNVENSPLPSNNVISIAIDGETGEVFFGTDNGIASYKGQATEGNETHSDVYVYPNPVRHDYNGPIAVKGLVDDAIVKITDVSGRLVYETRAYGGQAVWDGNHPNGYRAKSGVYLVFSSNDDGSEKFVAKFVLIK